jgi:hypothetical protein
MMPSVEHVIFYLIVPATFDDLLCNPEAEVFTCSLQSARLGVLAVSPEYLDHGAFKTVQNGYLTLLPAATSGLGSKANHHVAVKRLFMNGHRDENGFFHITRYSNAIEENEVTMTEANMLYWSDSLFSFALSYIEHFLATHLPPTDFQVPQLRFVHAGVAVVQSPSSEITRTYLLEEFIDDHRTEFVKYINNNNAAPREMTSVDRTEVAEFLCFTQHFQYWKSGGRVYLSDLQGQCQPYSSIIFRH